MENQDFNSKLAEVYRELSEKTNNFDMLNTVFEKMLEKREQYQAFDVVSLKKLVYTVLKFENLTEIKRKKRSMVIIESEITPLSDEEIASIMDYTPDRPESKQNPSVKYVKICAGICRAIKDKKIKKFFVYRYVKGLKTNEIIEKLGLNTDNRMAVKRLSDKFEDIMKKLPKELIEDLQYYQGIVRGDRRNTAIGDLVDIVAGECKFPKMKENFSWSRLKSISGIEKRVVKKGNKFEYFDVEYDQDYRELPDFIDDYREKLDTDNNDLILQAILTDNPMPIDRLPLQKPDKFRITARKQTL